MMPRSTARVSQESSRRSKILVGPVKSSPSYRAPITTGVLTLVRPPQISVIFTPSSGGDGGGPSVSVVLLTGGGATSGGGAVTAGFASAVVAPSSALCC